MTFGMGLVLGIAIGVFLVAWLGMLVVWNKGQREFREQRQQRQSQEQ